MIQQYCIKDGRPCESTGCANGYCVKDNYPKNITSLIGWECPRCHVINSPFKSTCDCVPQLKSNFTTGK